MVPTNGVMMSTDSSAERGAAKLADVAMPLDSWAFSDATEFHQALRTVAASFDRLVAEGRLQVSPDCLVADWRRDPSTALAHVRTLLDHAMEASAWFETPRGQWDRQPRVTSLWF